MSKQQAVRPLSMPETKEGNGAKLTLVKGSLPNIEDLDSILEESEKVIENASVSMEQIDEMVGKRGEMLEQLYSLESTHERRLQRVADFDPLKDLNPGDYNRLVSVGIVDSASAEKLQKLEEVISRLSELEQPTSDVRSELKRLKELRKSFRKQLKVQIGGKKQEICERRERVRCKLSAHYSKRVTALLDSIEEIEANPRVLDRLWVLEKEERQKLEEESRQFIELMNESTQSLSIRHAKAFERLSEVTGSESIAQDLLKSLLKDYGQRQNAYFDGVRGRLITSVIDGEGRGQLKGPKEVAPWIERTDEVPYVETMNSLRYRGNRERLRSMAQAGDEQAAQLLKACKQLANENAVLRKLVGRKHVTDHKTGKKGLGSFWAAFETRRQNDKSGVTEARKKQRREAAKLEAKARKAVAEIIKGGGFAVDVPVYRKIRGRQQSVGASEGAVRLERAKSKKGNDLWQVAEVAGAAEVLAVGTTSTLNMSSFPSWVRDSAKDKFIMHGEDFVELLVYESEDQEG